MKLKNKSNQSYKECDIWIRGPKSDKTFVITVKLNIIDKTDFSIILMYVDRNGIRYILRRYNGIHPHTNKIERIKIRSFHIHTGTERYQMKFDEIDGYAEETTLYNNWIDAFALMRSDCNLKGKDMLISQLTSIIRV
jgi:hypothetical protein